MVRKCDTTKYKRFAKRQRKNRGERKHRLQLREIEFHRKREEKRRRALEAKLADPRRLLVQRLVNILYAQLRSNPAYQVLETAKLFGVDPERLIKEIESGNLNYGLPPGYVWLKEGSPGSGRYA